VTAPLDQDATLAIRGDAGAPRHEDGIDGYGFAWLFVAGVAVPVI
jgi:hypothetical protein